MLAEYMVDKEVDCIVQYCAKRDLENKVCIKPIKRGKLEERGGEVRKAKDTTPGISDPGR